MGKKTKILVLVVCVLFLVPATILGYFCFKVVSEVSGRIERGAIDRIIASESPVYYDDGRTPIGVFFEKTHRKYTRYKDIPDMFIKALVAAEDKDFFTHWGFDLKAMLRAFVANARAGRVVQGGSTITQQTAKNIFKREKRSYKAKLKEVIEAFLLEWRYTKEEILEMYANQFFVTGYGKGLKIAAQYYFGKDLRDLDLVEVAFIVGSVKGPNRYNPFIKKTQTKKAINHEIIILFGLPQQYCLAILTHELFHAWLHENIDQNKLSPQDTEWLCDFMAWHILKAIKSAPYWIHNFEHSMNSHRSLIKKRVSRLSPPLIIIALKRL